MANPVFWKKSVLFVVWILVAWVGNSCPSYADSQGYVCEARVHHKYYETFDCFGRTRAQSSEPCKHFQFPDGYKIYRGQSKPTLEEARKAAMATCQEIPQWWYDRNYFSLYYAEDKNYPKPALGQRLVGIPSCEVINPKTCGTNFVQDGSISIFDPLFRKSSKRAGAQETHSRPRVVRNGASSAE